MSFHLAQVNLAYGRAPIDDPLLADFVARIEEINTLAERSPGFIWRYRSDAGYPQEFGDPRVLFNMSVWESVEALHAFTYRTDHAELFAARKKWFSDVKEGIGLVGMAMWWVPAGELPTVAESKQRLAHLTEHGPTAHAFTFKQRFSPEGVKLANVKIA
jgi:heme-degrading monooxygenase HmoA